MASRDPLTFNASARTDVRYWGMFLVGSAFLYAGWTIDPASNCSEGGECAPWLVPLGFMVGLLFALSGLATLIANPGRGSRIDPVSGELTWWQNRGGRHAGDHGSIAPEAIGLIRLIPVDDAADEVHLYDLAGKRLPFFDEEVIGGDQAAWVAAMQARWPHIQVETGRPQPSVR